MRLKSTTSVAIKLFVVQYFLSILVSSTQDFDFFYLVQQWPGSYCDTKRSCCYPTTGKPDEDFSIHGLWPNYITGKWPQNCILNDTLDVSQISDLLSTLQKDWPTLACPSADGIKFWGHEWEKHGTCSSLDQHSYFQATLDLKHRSNLLQVLENADIYPGDFYSLKSIKQAIQEGVGHEPFIQCNADLLKNSQFFEVYLCVDKSASNFIECPILPKGKTCKSSIEFPSFSSYSSGSLAQ